MTVKNSRGLGRNLSALLGNSNYSLLQTPATNLPTLNLELLKPGKYQPRKNMDGQSLQELSNSIKQQGVIQPLLVRELEPDLYEIIAGERRWRAAKLAGLHEVPVIIRKVDEETAMALALIENLQREDLNPLDEARAMLRLTEEFLLTHQQVADLLSKSRATVSNALRLLSLSEEVMSLLEQKAIDMGHARALLSLEKDKQLLVAKAILSKNLSVRETEKFINRIKLGLDLESIPKAGPSLGPQIDSQIKKLSEQLKTKIQVHQNKAGKGRIIIHYDSLQFLDVLMQELTELPR